MRIGYCRSWPRVAVQKYNAGLQFTTLLAPLLQPIKHSEAVMNGSPSNDTANVEEKPEKRVAEQVRDSGG